MANGATALPRPPSVPLCRCAGTPDVRHTGYWTRECRTCWQELRPGYITTCVSGGHCWSFWPFTRRVWVDTTPEHEPVPLRDVLPLPIVKPTPRPVPATPPAAVEEATDEAIVEWLRTLPKLPGRDAVKSRFGVGSGKANRCLELARAAGVT